MQENVLLGESGPGTGPDQTGSQVHNVYWQERDTENNGPGNRGGLYRFGPMGVSISFARPGIFVWSRQNNTEVVLTSRRIYGQGKMPAFASIFGKAGTPVFDVPLQEIIAIEPVDFLMNKAVWIRYRTMTGQKEVAIIGAALCHGHITRLMELVRRLVPKA